MFRHYLNQISEMYTFGSTETEFWKPEFEINFSALNFASGNLKRDTKTKYDNRLEAALWDRARIAWDLSDLTYCDKIDPQLYVYFICFTRSTG